MTRCGTFVATAGMPAPASALLLAMLGRGRMARAGEASAAGLDFRGGQNVAGVTDRTRRARSCGGSNLPRTCHHQKSRPSRPSTPRGEQYWNISIPAPGFEDAPHPFS